ncbi:MAG: UPF0175 family protein [Bacteroidota bacterium]
MTTLTLELPSDLDPARVRLGLAVLLYQEGAISLGYGAEVAALSLHDFVNELAQREVPVIDYPAEELDDELAHLDGLGEE